jgi:hypothetical protein
MIMASKDVIVNTFELLSANWPDYECTDNTIRLYHLVLEDLPDAAVKAAAVKWVSKDTPWFPKAGQLRSEALGILEEQKPLPLEAWGKVVKHLKRPQSMYHDGHRYTLKPLDDIIEAAVEDVGGWDYLRFSENIMADRANFRKAYEARLERYRAKERTLPAIERAKAELLESGE